MSDAAMRAGATNDLPALRGSIVGDGSLADSSWSRTDGAADLKAIPSRPQRRQRGVVW